MKAFYRILPLFLLSPFLPSASAEPVSCEWVDLGPEAESPRSSRPVDPAPGNNTRFRASKRQILEEAACKQQGGRVPNRRQGTRVRCCFDS